MERPSSAPRAPAERDPRGGGPASAISAKADARERFLAGLRPPPSKVISPPNPLPKPECAPRLAPCETPSARVRSKDPQHADGPECEGLAPFRPMSTVLMPPGGAKSLGAARGSGEAFERAEMAVLAERLVTGLRVGRVGHDGHVVDLRLRGVLGGLGVRLEHEGGVLRVRLGAAPGARAATVRFGTALRAALDASGLGHTVVEVEDA